MSKKTFRELAELLNDFEMYVKVRIYKEIDMFENDNMASKELVDTYVNAGFKIYEMEDRVSPEDIGIAIFDIFHIVFYDGNTDIDLSKASENIYNFLEN